MGKAQPVTQAKDAASPAPLPVITIDRMLSELAALYLERFKAMRAGDPAAVETLSNRINDIKTILGQI